MRVAVLSALGMAMGAGYVSRIPAVDDHASVMAGSEVSIDVLANDGVLGPDLTLLRVSGNGQLGTAVVDGQQVRFIAAEGVSGREQLSYSVRRANGQVAGGRIFVTVEPVSVQLSLHGMIADTLPTCDLAIVVGAQRYEGCTTAGTFQFDIDTADTESVVVIEGTAQPLDVAQDYRYASVLGSVSRLLEMAQQAGTPGELHWSQFGHLRLQEYTSMHHAQLVAEGGPEVFASEAALAQVQKDLDAQRLHALAMSFRAARRGWVALPPGIADPYAFAFDLPAFEDFYATTMPPVLDQAHHELVNLSDIQMPWLPGQPIGAILGGYGAAPGNINVPTIEGRQVFLQDDGQARVYSAHLGPRSLAGWQHDTRGSVDVHQEEPAIGFSVINLQCGTSTQQFMKAEKVRLQRITRVVQTAQSDVTLFQTENQFDNWNQIPEGCTSPQPEYTYETWAIQTFGRDQVLPMGGAHTSGRWAVRLPAPSNGTLGGLGFGTNAGIIDLDELTVQAPGLEEGISVMLNGDNGLDILMQAGPQQDFALIDTQFFRTRTDGRGGEQWLGNARGDDYSGVGLGGLAARETHPDLFADVSQAWGAWRSSFAIVTQGRHLAFPTELIFEVLPGSPGRGVRHQIQPNGASFPMPFAWEVDSTGRVVMTTWYSRVTYQYVAECVDDCFIFQRRTWQPVSLDESGEGKRLYMIEEILQGNWYDDELSLAGRRVNFYDETIVPERAEPAPVLTPRARMR